MEKYLDDFSKMVLVVESLKEYKSTLTKEKGIGEDLTFNIFGWRADGVSVVAQLAPNFMKDKRRRLLKLIEAATIFRTGFACDALSFGTEAFCVMDGDETLDSKSLAEQFATNKSVLECLLVLHVGEETHLAAIPYKYGVGRTVIYGNPATASDPEALGMIKESFADILEIEPESKFIDDPFFMMHLINGMQKDGFEVTVTGDL
jgi:hypothetical protein